MPPRRKRRARSPAHATAPVGSHAPGRPQLLERAAQEVLPVMQQRSWHVRLLQEFYPTQEGLLGVNINRGSAIKVRLRRPRDAASLLPYPDVLGTLLHELCHNVHSNHSAAFYDLLDELWSEVEGGAGAAAGGGTKTAPSFTGEAHRLDHGKRNLSQAEARRAAVAAAQRRRTATGSGRALGGGKAPRGRSARELAVEAAARRAGDARSCGCMEQPAVNDGGGAAALEAAAAAIRRLDPAGATRSLPMLARVLRNLLRHPDDPKYRSLSLQNERLAEALWSVEGTANFLEAAGFEWGDRVLTFTAGPSRAQAALDALGAAAEEGRGTKRPRSAPDGWLCGACTFSNPKAIAPVCEMCGTPRE